MLTEVAVVIPGSGYGVCIGRRLTEAEGSSFQIDRKTVASLIDGMVRAVTAGRVERIGGSIGFFCARCTLSAVRRMIAVGTRDEDAAAYVQETSGKLRRIRVALPLLGDETVYRTLLFHPSVSIDDPAVRTVQADLARHVSSARRGASTVASQVWRAPLDRPLPPPGRSAALRKHERSRLLTRRVPVKHRADGWRARALESSPPCFLNPALRYSGCSPRHLCRTMRSGPRRTAASLGWRSSKRRPRSCWRDGPFPPRPTKRRRRTRGHGRSSSAWGRYCRGPLCTLLCHRDRLDRHPPRCLLLRH